MSLYSRSDNSESDGDVSCSPFSSWTLKRRYFFDNSICDVAQNGQLLLKDTFLRDLAWSFQTGLTVSASCSM